jgi:hypothetical protein
MNVRPLARFAAAIVALTLGVLASPKIAQAGVVTFDSLGGVQGDYFTSVTENGVTVTGQPFAWRQSHSFGNGAPAVYADLAFLSVTTGGLFTFNSYDVAGDRPNAPVPPSALYYGYRDGNLVFSANAPLAGTGFITINNLYPDILIDQLDIRSDGSGLGGSNHIDNIVVTPAGVPDAANTSAMLLLGLVALVAVRRRIV